MSSLKGTARRAGFLYLVMAVMMIFSYMVAPGLFSGDAATTARKIADHEFLYRASILISFAAQIIFVFVVLTLYELFRDVNRHWAGLMVGLVLVGVAAEVVNVAYRMAPLLLARTPDYGTAFTRAQLEVLGDGFITLGNNLGRFLTAFWGLWLIPFGLLTARSGYVPRVLGYLLLAAGAGYMATCVTYILFPGSLPIVSKLATPLYFGEPPIILWLLVMGAKAPPDRSALPT